MLLVSVNPSYAIQGTVIGISDGDTITVLTDDKVQYKIRLYGIDCPESHQDFGTRAKQFASDMIYKTRVTVETVTTDRYGRTVGIVHIAGKSLNEELIRHGYAWVYPQYCKKPVCAAWNELEQQARASKIGLWSHANPVPPWEFRRPAARRSPDNQTTGPYHGNTQSQVFHHAGCKHYNCKHCTAVFKTKDAAVQAGYRPCGMCLK